MSLFLRSLPSPRDFLVAKQKKWQSESKKSQTILLSFLSLSNESCCRAQQTTKSVRFSYGGEQGHAIRKCFRPPFSFDYPHTFVPSWFLGLVWFPFGLLCEMSPRTYFLFAKPTTPPPRRPRGPNSKGSK